MHVIEECKPYFHTTLILNGTIPYVAIPMNLPQYCFDSILAFDIRSHQRIHYQHRLHSKSNKSTAENTAESGSKPGPDRYCHSSHIRSQFRNAVRAVWNGEGQACEPESWKKHHVYTRGNGHRDTDAHETQAERPSFETHFC